MEKLNTCHVCKEQYNLTNKIPKMLIPCGHTVCEECLFDKKNPQDKDQLLCYVYKDHPEKIEHFITNTSIVDSLKNNFGMMVVCEKHKTKPAEFLDLKNKKLVCYSCAFSDK